VVAKAALCYSHPLRELLLTFVRFGGKICGPEKVVESAPVTMPTMITPQPFFGFMPGRNRVIALLKVRPPDGFLDDR
jgi:hypothetical protein